jgi:hypothetical protein
VGSHAADDRRDPEFDDAHSAPGGG